MSSGERGSSGWAAHGLGLALCLLAGCAGGGPELNRALMAERPPPAPAAEAVRDYALGCPDVLLIDVPGRPDLSGRKAVDAEGRIDLGELGRLRVEGRTAAQVARYLADIAETPARLVQVRVAEFHSQHVYLVGQVAGWQRPVPYEGPETVLALLQRAGGLAPGAAADDVYVVRSQVAIGRQPEVFHVNLRDVVMSHDDQTNIRLQPFDQVYVGETRRSSLCNCIPFCVRPIYQAICGLRKHVGLGQGGTGQAQPPAPSPSPSPPAPAGRATVAEGTPNAPRSAPGMLRSATATTEPPLSNLSQTSATSPR